MKLLACVRSDKLYRQLICMPLLFQDKEQRGVWGGMSDVRDQGEEMHKDGIRRHRVDPYADLGEKRSVKER